jgi:CubicO group peptidase (beta-lactamase class C family)
MVSFRWKLRQTGIASYWIGRWSQLLENAGTTTAVRRQSLHRWWRGGTAKPLLEFAKERLFSPLGITDVQWRTDRTGEPRAASGLRLRPRDLAKIGQLVLQRGQWGERQIVPVGWLQEATAPHAQAEPFLHYGYQWWLGGSGFGDVQTPWVAGFGNGGQGLFYLA